MAIVENRRISIQPSEPEKEREEKFPRAGMEIRNKWRIAVKRNPFGPRTREEGMRNLTRDDIFPRIFYYFVISEGVQR